MNVLVLKNMKKKLKRWLSAAAAFVIAAGVFTFNGADMVSAAESAAGGTVKVTMSFDCSSIGTEEALKELTFDADMEDITVEMPKNSTVYDAVLKAEEEHGDVIEADETSKYISKIYGLGNALEGVGELLGFEDIPGEAHGYYHQIEKRIALQEEMSELQNIKTLIHETAHARLHAIDLAAPEEERADQPDQSTREVQAESVAYVVCQHFGLDTSDYSFAYVAGWSSGKEMPELRASLDVIRNAAKETITAIEGQLSLRREYQKESPEKAKQEEPEAGITRGRSERPEKGKEMVRCL